MLLLTTNTGWARTITVVSYNVQNLFDATDDGGEYRQFTRAGGWTSELYTAKLRAIGSALRAAEPGGADLVALQEVEHYDAARRLVDQELDGLGYRHVVWLPDPHNATGPVVLSKLPVRRVGALWVDSSSPVDDPADGLKGGLDRPLRPILEVEVALGAAADAPSLFLFNNHWKSKRGGAAETEGSRRRAAALLAARAIHTGEGPDPRCARVTPRAPGPPPRAARCSGATAPQHPLARVFAWRRLPATCNASVR